VDYSAGLIALLLTEFGTPWLLPAIPLVGLAPLVLTTFCGTDPPAIPTFTSAETNAILQLQFGPTFDSALAKLKDLVQHEIWYDTCVCTSGSLTPFPAIVPPAGTPITQPPNPQNAPCRTFTTDSMGCYSAGSGISGFGGVTMLTLGGQVSSAICTLVNSTCTGAGLTLAAFWEWFDASGSVIRNDAVSNAPGQTTTVTLIPPANANELRLGINATGTGTTSRQGSTVQFFCNGQLPGPSAPCCAPNPATQASLDAILAMATLIQRQIAPFGYVASTVHPGLTGDGQLVVSDLIGAKVHITSPLVAPIGQEAGNPPALYGAGWVNWGGADGFGPREFIGSDPVLTFPPAVGVYTLIGYSLPPGLTVSITELVREA
jgi:hypothetical protein